MDFGEPFDEVAKISSNAIGSDENNQHHNHTARLIVVADRRLPPELEHKAIKWKTMEMKEHSTMNRTRVSGDYNQHQ